MKYKLLILILYIFSTLPLFSEEKGLGDVLQKSGEEKSLVKPFKKKKQRKRERKRSRFIFKDTYESHGIEQKGKNIRTKESQKYDYENKPRFKFKFTPGTGYSNMMEGQGNRSGSAGGGRRGGGAGGGGGGRGRR